jgi:tripartite-type tricarboxylate transporter receptor subunit TctC
MITNSNLPVKTLADLVAYLRQNPGKVSYGTSGTVGQMVWTMFKKRYELTAVGIPYKGATETIVSLISDVVQVTFDNPIIYLPHIIESKLRAIAYTGEPRLPQLPDVPTVTEQGFVDLAVSFTSGLWVKKNTPPEIIERLSAELKVILAQPDVKEKIRSLSSVDPVTLSPAELSKITDIEWKFFTEAAQ